MQVFNTNLEHSSIKKSPFNDYVSKMKNKTSINILHEVNQFENVKLEIIFFNEILNIKYFNQIFVRFSKNVTLRFIFK